MRMLLFLFGFLISSPALAGGKLMPWQGGVGAGPYILVSNSERALYWVRGDGYAVRYKVAVGVPARQWTGETRVAFKMLDPTWRPPQALRQLKPWLAAEFAPGPKNPLGAAVLVLGDGTFGIHGTNQPSSIGHEVSFGCIRMHNEDVLALYQHVEPGTPVIVTR